MGLLGWSREMGLLGWSREMGLLGWSREMGFRPFPPFAPPAPEGLGGSGGHRQPSLARHPLTKRQQQAPPPPPPPPQPAGPTMKTRDPLCVISEQLGPDVSEMAEGPPHARPHTQAGRRAAPANASAGSEGGVYSPFGIATGQSGCSALVLSRAGGYDLETLLLYEALSRHNPTQAPSLPKVMLSAKECIRGVIYRVFRMLQVQAVFTGAGLPHHGVRGSWQSQPQPQVACTELLHVRDPNVAEQQKLPMC